jgi:hypothetical protein
MDKLQLSPCATAFCRSNHVLSEFNGICQNLGKGQSETGIMTGLKISWSSVFELNFSASEKFRILFLGRLAFCKLDWFPAV